MPIAPQYKILVVAEFNFTQDLVDDILANTFVGFTYQIAFSLFCQSRIFLQIDVDFPKFSPTQIFYHIWYVQPSL